MMLDAGAAAVGPTSVRRVLHDAGLLTAWNGKQSKKGMGFVQPLLPHERWHVDVSYINICGTFYYLCSVLDGCSRYIVHGEVREAMTETDIEIIFERAKEAFPEARPRIISDNGPQFIAKDFKEFIRISGSESRWPCSDLAVLSTKQRQYRAPAQVIKDRMHPPANAAVARRRPAPRGAYWSGRPS